MTFGFGDVCTRANARGEKGGDEAAEGKTVPQAISQLSHHSLPPRAEEKAAEPHAGVTWSYQADGWRGGGGGWRRTGREGVFVSLAEGHRQQRARAGKLAKMNGRAVGCRGRRRAAERHVCRRVTNAHGVSELRKSPRPGGVRLYLRRQVGPRPRIVAHAPMLRLAERRADYQRETRALGTNEKQILGRRDERPSTPP